MFATQAKQEGLTTHDIRRGTDAPTFLMIFALLSTMPLHTAYAIWLLTNFTCLAFAFFLLIRPNLYIAPVAALILTGFAILYPPITFHFWFGQSKLPVVLLLVLMMRCMGRGRDEWAGFSLALGALLRLFPLAMIGYLVLQRRRKTFACTIMGLVAGSLFTVAFTGVNNYLAFFSITTITDSRFVEARHLELLFHRDANVVFAVTFRPCYRPIRPRCLLSSGPHYIRGYYSSNVGFSTRQRSGLARLLAVDSGCGAGPTDRMGLRLKSDVDLI